MGRSALKSLPHGSLASNAVYLTTHESAINVAMIVGEQIGSYRIEGVLDEGGMGVVYVGVHLRLGRRDAIKQLRPELSGRRDVVERFVAEAKAVANIDHPGIVKIYEVGRHIDGSAYFAMQLLEGDSLARRLRAGPLPPATACTVAQQIAYALAAAHAVGIVHRDLKPDNIILVRDDVVALGERAIVLDFGIAKFTGDWLMLHKTRTGSVIGTPPYMSPEQCRGAGEIDHRSDVYAMGCILFEMLTGRPPFEGAGDGEVIGQHLFFAPPTVRSLRPDVSPELEALVLRCLAKQPDKRYQTMTELIAALKPYSLRVNSANEAVPPEIGASPASPPTGGLPTPQLRPRKLPAPAGDLRLDAPVEGEQGERESDSRSEVVTPQPRARKRKLFFGVDASVIVVAVVFTLSAGVERPSSDPAGPLKAAFDAPSHAGPLEAALDAPSHATDPPEVTLDAPSATAGLPDAALGVAPADAPAVTTANQDAALAAAMQDAASGISVQLSKAQFAKAQLAKAKQALDEERWQDVLDIGNNILRRDPTNADAQNIKVRAQSELTNEGNYKTMTEQIKSGQPGWLSNAITSYHKIPKNTVYYDLARQAIVKEIRVVAQALSLNHQCAELQDLANAAGDEMSGAGVANLHCQNLPQSLDAKMIGETVAKVKEEVFNSCNKWSPAKKQVRVSVQVTVEPDGQVDVEVKETPDTTLGNCVVDVIRKSKRLMFPKTQMGGSSGELGFNFR
jgi:serine/threonine-protein kinase